MESTPDVQFRIISLTEDENKVQVAEFVAMMGRMYDYHAGLHPDWQQKPGWQKNSRSWIKKAAGNNEWFFAMAYPESAQNLPAAAGYIIAGFHYEAPLFIRSRYGYIADMWVEPDQRGTGAATALLEAALAFLKAQGVDRVQLEVMVNNEAGKRFWQKAGFEPFELIMRRDL